MPLNMNVISNSSSKINFSSDHSGQIPILSEINTDSSSFLSLSSYVNEIRRKKLSSSTDEDYNNWTYVTPGKILQLSKNKFLVFERIKKTFRILTISESSFTEVTSTVIPNSNYLEVVEFDMCMLSDNVGVYIIQYHNQSKAYINTFKITNSTITLGTSVSTNASIQSMSEIGTVYDNVNIVKVTSIVFVFSIDTTICLGSINSSKTITLGTTLTLSSDLMKYGVTNLSSIVVASSTLVYFPIAVSDRSQGYSDLYKYRLIYAIYINTSTKNISKAAEATSYSMDPRNAFMYNGKLCSIASPYTDSVYIGWVQYNQSTKKITVGSSGSSITAKNTTVWGMSHQFTKFPNTFMYFVNSSIGGGTDYAIPIPVILSSDSTKISAPVDTEVDLSDADSRKLSSHAYYLTNKQAYIDDNTIVLLANSVDGIYIIYAKYGCKAIEYDSDRSIGISLGKLSSGKSGVGIMPAK